MPTTKFSAQHYNALAKEIREIFPTGHESYVEPRFRVANAERGILATFALNLCKRFQEDNPRFNPIRFLDACSPDTNLYPLSELWESNE